MELLPSGDQASAAQVEQSRRGRTHPGPCCGQDGKGPWTSLPLEAGISVKATCGRDGTYAFLRLRRLQSPHRGKTEWTGPVTGERTGPVTGDRRGPVTGERREPSDIQPWDTEVQINAGSSVLGAEAGRVQRGHSVPSCVSLLEAKAGRACIRTYSACLGAMSKTLCSVGTCGVPPLVMSFAFIKNSRQAALRGLRECLPACGSLVPDVGPKASQGPSERSLESCPVWSTPLVRRGLWSSLSGPGGPHLRAAN